MKTVFSHSQRIETLSPKGIEPVKIYPGHNSIEDDVYKELIKKERGQPSIFSLLLDQGVFDQSSRPVDKEESTKPPSIEDLLWDEIKKKVKQAGMKYEDIASGAGITVEVLKSLIDAKGTQVAQIKLLNFLNDQLVKK